MILSDKTIKEMLDSGEMELSPLTDESIQPASVDIRLGDSFKVPADYGVIGFDKEIGYVDLESQKDGIYVVPPHSFVLATTMEYIKLPDDISAQVEGRSSIGRMGLFIQNAGWVDAGFEGEITLELYNAGPNYIKLSPGHRIGQLVFHKMTTLADKPYRGKYQGQMGATGSRKHLDKDNK